MARAIQWGMVLLLLSGCTAAPWRESSDGQYRSAVIVHFESALTSPVKVYGYMPQRGYGRSVTCGATLGGPLHLYRGDVEFNYGCPAPATQGKATLTFKRPGSYYLYCKADGSLAFAETPPPVR